MFKLVFNVFSYIKDIFYHCNVLCYFIIFAPILFNCCRIVFSSKCHFVVARRLPRLSILAAFLGGLFLLLVSDKKTEMMKK